MASRKKATTKAEGSGPVTRASKRSATNKDAETSVKPKKRVTKSPEKKRVRGASKTARAAAKKSNAPQKVPDRKKTPLPRLPPEILERIARFSREIVPKAFLLTMAGYPYQSIVDARVEDQCLALASCDAAEFANVRPFDKDRLIYNSVGHESKEAISWLIKNHMLDDMSDILVFQDALICHREARFNLFHWLIENHIGIAYWVFPQPRASDILRMRNAS